MSGTKRILNHYDGVLNGDAWHGDAVWRLFREQHNFHYAELEAMPSEPPAPPESAPPPPVKAAVQLPLF